MPDTIYPDELSDSYDIQETIGSGGFAKVKLATHRLTNEKVAIKMMSKQTLAHDLPRVYTEIATMKELCHQNICQLYEVLETEEEIFMILEYAPGGELFDYIVAKDRLEEKEARHFLRQIVAAVGYMHENGYAHRDLKPENLLLDENQDIKLIDFGLVGKPEGGMSQTLETCCGSPAYAAPELISGVPYFGNEADLWSLGVLLYALLCGFLPFDDDNTYNLYKAIQRGEYEIPSFLSKGSVALIGQLLKTDPKQRLTVKQLFMHPWLNKGYANPVNARTRVKKDEPDSDVVKELALSYGVSPTTMTSVVKESTEVKNSNAMELEALKRQLAYFEQSNVTAKKLVTDRHSQVSSYLAEEKPDIQHAFDVWHVSKGEKKRLLKVVKIKKFRKLKPWIGYRFDDLTASYFLLCKKKSRGEPLKFSNSCTKALRKKRKDMLAIEKRLSEAKEDTPNNINYDAPPSILVDDEDDVFPADLRDFRKPRACTLPPEIIATPPIDKMPSALPFPNNFLTPTTKQEHTVPSSASNYEFGSGKPLSPETKFWSQSLDRNLDRGPWANGTPRQQSKSASSRRFSQRNFFDSIEGGLHRFIDVFTPRRSTSSHPRKVKALYNVSTTTSKGADEVLEELQKVIEKKSGWMYKSSGYTIRCKTVDDRGKVVLDFELEVCELPKVELMGVRRKRLKGDTWAYKKVCEDILKEAGL